MSTELQKRALGSALALLKASGAKYKVITEDGQEYGELEVAAPRKVSAKTGKPLARRKYRHTKGEMRAYYLPFLEKCGVGEEVTVPYGHFSSPEDKTSLRGAICGYCSHYWGTGKDGYYMSTMMDDGVHVLRIKEKSA